MNQFVAVLLALFLGSISFSVLADDLTIGQPAPDLTLHALDGRVYRLSDLRGKVVVLVFWASWCAACQQELPVLSAFAERHAAQGVQVLGFSLDGLDELPQVRSIATALKFPVGELGSSWAGGYGRIWRLPVSFVVDRKGLLAFNGWERPSWRWNEADMTRLITPLL